MSLGIQLVGGPTAILEYGPEPHFLPSARQVLSTTRAAGELEAAFSGNGLRDRLLMLERGQRAEA